jgi:hypothetical protein
MRFPLFDTFSLAVACCLLGGVSAAQESDDASEIAARAAASAIAGIDGAELDRLSAESYDAIARDLAARIEAIEKERGHVSRERVVPMVELARLHLSAGQCPQAIPLLKDALRLVQQIDGVLTASQLPIYDTLLECLVSREMLPDLKRAQDQVLLIHENAFGKHGERRVEDLEVRDASAPTHLRADIAENIRRTPFRPRFHNGDTVDTHGVTIRQGMWVEQ